ncbi:hypothetical protein Tco_1279241, partial [Tanacetum coccineum]
VNEKPSGPGALLLSQSETVILISSNEPIGGDLPRLRERAHVRRLYKSGNKGQSFILDGSRKYYVLSCSSEPCSTPLNLEFLGGLRLRFGYTLLYIGIFPYGSPSGLYANEHPEAFCVQHRRLGSSGEMGYTIKPPTLMCYVSLS